jgi:ABC-type transport system involved in multi-copper enzyme maturation permease subunit
MTRIIKAELMRLVRRRTLLISVAGSVLFAVVATLTVFASAKSTGIANSRQGGTTIAKLAASGGATQAFAVGASFAGFLVFVTFIAMMAGEFSGGTFRALLLRDPHRRRMIAGKVVGLLIVTAGVAALAEIFSVVVSLALAP